MKYCQAFCILKEGKFECIINRTFSISKFSREGVLEMKREFISDYERKVFKIIKKYRLLEKGDNIFIALSGGKDSGAAGYMLVKYRREKGIECKLTAFHINFGLPFSERVEGVVRKQAEALDIPVVICNVSDYGIDMSRVARLKRPICSSCGVIKRYLMNKIPREMGANKVCTGHHADDFLTFFFKNMLGENYVWISKFTPLLPKEGKSIARIRPLFCVGGSDNKRFCNEIGFPYIEEDVCPHVFLKCGLDGKRERWYKVIEDISSWQKDFKERMMISVSKLAKELSLGIDKPGECVRCGEPTNTEVCAFCRLVEAQGKVKIA
jgi:tRNA(Ile)-lysidine synthase TilS/MesJ